MPCWANKCSASLAARRGMPALTKNSRQVGAGGQKSHSPTVSIKPCPPLSYQNIVRSACGGGTSNGSCLRSTNDRASLTKDAVSSPPAPIRKPRREIINKPPSCTRIREVSRPTVGRGGPHRRATVAGQGWLAGPKPSLDVLL